MVSPPHELPEELVLKIFSCVPTNRLPHTILACKLFSRIATPLLYRDITIRSAENVLSCCRSIVARGEGIGRLVRSLMIEVNAFSSFSPPMEGDLVASLHRCAKLMVQLERFSCLVLVIMPPYLCLAFATIPTLQDLRIPLTSRTTSLTITAPPLAGKVDHLVPNTGPLNLRRLYLLDLRDAHDTSGVYDEVVEYLMRGENIEEVDLRTSPAKVRDTLRLMATEKCVVKSLILCSLDPDIFLILGRLPSLCSLTMYSCSPWPITYLATSQTAPRPLKKLCCPSYMLHAMVSYFSGLSIIHIDGAAYPVDHFLDRLSNPTVYGYFTAIFSTLAPYATSLRYLALTIGDMSDMMSDHVPTFSSLETLVIRLRRKTNTIRVSRHTTCLAAQFFTIVCTARRFRAILDSTLYARATVAKALFHSRYRGVVSRR